jgi:hypothetical protein
MFGCQPGELWWSWHGTDRREANQRKMVTRTCPDEVWAPIFSLYKIKPDRASDD